MSSNVASFSTGATSNLPTVGQAKAWSREDVKAFLQNNKTELDLEDGDIDKIYNQKIKGDTFLDLTRDDLLSIQIPLGPAKKIVKLNNDIQGGKRTSFSLTPCHICQ
jgi:hypothetical protein